MSTTFFTSCLLSAALAAAAQPEWTLQPVAEPGGPTAARKADEQAKPGKMKQVTYAVADLVVPIGPAACSVPKAPGKEGKSGEKEAAQEKQPPRTTEAELMKLIRASIRPQTWSDQGGSGTMQYHSLGMALVINQTQEIQEEIAALLTALRRLQDVEVAVEIRLVSVSEAFFERIGVDFELNGPSSEAGGNDGTVSPAIKPEPDSLAKLKEMSFLNDLQLRQLLEAAQGDRRTNIMQAPKITVFNGQRATIDITETQHFVTELKTVREGDQVFVLPKNEAVKLGVEFSVQPVVSADRKNVLVDFKGKLSNLESPTVPAVPVTTHLTVKDKWGKEQVVPVQQFVQQPAIRTMTVDKSFRVADGATAVLCWGKTLTESRQEYGPPVLSRVPYVNRLFRNVGYGRETQTLLLLITPRIIINEEEEAVFLGGTPPIPRP